MSATGSSQGNMPVLRRIRCGQCRLPLIQLYEGDLLYTLHRHGDETASQQLPAYSYRALTDPTPLLTCPRCGAMLSPATVSVVTPETLVTEESKTTPDLSDL